MRYLAILAVAALSFLHSMPASAASCSDGIRPCVDKAVSLGADAKAYRPKCVSAANRCKKTGCFVGPTSGITFACGLEKR